VDVEGRGADGSVLATRDLALNAHQLYVGDTPDLFPQTGAGVLGLVKRVDYTVTVGADGRVDGSSQFDGRIVGYRVDGLFGLDGPTLVTGMKLSNIDDLRTLVETSDYNPLSNSAQVIYRDGPGLVSLTAIANTNALVAGASYNPPGYGVFTRGYSFANQAKTPSRMLNAEGLTANGVVYTELQTPYGNYGNTTPGSRVYNSAVTFNFADGTAPKSKAAMTVTEGWQYNMTTSYPGTWQKIVRDNAAPLAQLCILKYYTNGSPIANNVSLSDYEYMLSQVGQPTSGADIADIILLNESPYTRLLLDFTAPLGLEYYAMTPGTIGQALMVRWMDILGVGPRSIHQY
jgi:hypothetical protein